MQTVEAKIEASKGSAESSRRFVLGSSVIVWLIITLLAVDYVIYTIRPLKYVKSVQYLPIDQNPIVSKIPEFFDSSIRPDALVLGSSLPMTAIAYYDYEYIGESPAKLGQVRVYTKAKYLQDQLTRLLHEPLNVFNLSCYGCMASEAHLLLSRAIDDGRKPKYVFYGIAPRDLIDNSVPPVGQTPVYEVLADWRCINDIFSGNLQLPQISDLFVGYIWYYYRVKADYRTFLTAVFSDILNRPATLYEATSAKARAITNRKVQANAAVEENDSGGKPDITQGSICVALETASREPKSDWDKSLTEYQSRYNPPNLKRYAQELSYFNRMTKLCKEKNVKLVVFNMPLADENKKLLDKQLYNKYLADVSRATNEFGGRFINLDKPDAYTRQDFLDCAHLNAAGGKKLQDNLLSQIVHSLNQ